jgi:hypothetical protein
MVAHGGYMFGARQSMNMAVKDHHDVVADLFR